MASVDKDAPSVSAEDERIRFAVETLRHLGYTAGAIDLRAAIRAAEAARDARWREALDRAAMGCEHGFRFDEPCHEESCNGAPLRALLGSGATAPTAPSSASGALAGAEEMTQKEKK